MKEHANSCLMTIGWSSAWENAFDAVDAGDGIPARVIREHRGQYVLWAERGGLQAEVSGRFRHHATGREDFPAVGDWVVVELVEGSTRAVIQSLLPRLSAFVRRSAGARSDAQVVAANVDTVFLVSGLDHDFNPRRIERYLTLSYESGADPVLVLNKADLYTDLDRIRAEAEAVAYGVPILLVSAVSGLGMDALGSVLAPGTTGALLGSSGVGKSTIVNALLGCEALRTAAVRDHDSRGRHTTTHRELIPLPNGAVLIDTPGMRELQLLGDDTSLEHSFGEIAELAHACRYRDCSHTKEPECAVQKALKDGALDAARYESYLSQRKEIRHHRIEQDVHLQQKEVKRWKAIHRSMRCHPKRGKGE